MPHIMSVQNGLLMRTHHHELFDIFDSLLYIFFYRYFAPVLSFIYRRQKKAEYVKSTFRVCIL